METSPPSGISVLIAGGGLAGLACAIESYRKGHTVRVLEARPNFDEHGGMINIGSSALHTPEKWPGFLELAREHCYEPLMHFYRYNGDFIFAARTGQPDYPSLPTTRGVLQRDLHAFARKLGVPVEFNARVEQYYDTAERGGVITSDGRKFEADIVIAADGVGSKSWTLVTGSKDLPASSGYSISWATLPINLALENPIIAKQFEGFKTQISLHMGPDVHVVVGKTQTDVSWYITHKLVCTSLEKLFLTHKQVSQGKDQSGTVPLDEALKHVHRWSPFVTQLIELTPDKIAHDWRILWRNPQPRWSSPNGRVIQIGDAAHSFLPTSNSGATMAWEDAFSIATCLKIGGIRQVPEAVRVHNLLRFERTACAQKTGFKNRERWHKTDWERMDEVPADVGKVVGNWILNHDSEQYAYDNYNKALDHLSKGTPFKNTNSVPGYTYRPWDIFQLAEASRNGENIEDEGDWS